jgi:NAD+-processing family protein with receiver domain
VNRLWVDDLRDPPAADWAVARTSAEAIERLAAGGYDELSLDHDLGGDDTTRVVVRWLCDHPDRWPGEVRVHTANPVGREWLLGMIGRYRP